MLLNLSYYSLTFSDYSRYCAGIFVFSRSSSDVTSRSRPLLLKSDSELLHEGSQSSLPLPALEVLGRSPEELPLPLLLAISPRCGALRLFSVFSLLFPNNAQCSTPPIIPVIVPAYSPHPYIETSNPQPAPEHVDILLMMKMLYMWTQRIGEVERVVLTAA